MISSKYIIEKSGISRASLNNYIRLGILPRPVVKKGGKDDPETRHLGFFPDSALENIGEVRRLKKEGMSMRDIADTFKQNRPATERDVPVQKQSPPEVAVVETSDAASWRDAVVLQVHFCVMAVAVSGRGQLKTALPAETYVRLLGDLWQLFAASAHKFGSFSMGGNQAAWQFFFKAENNPRYREQALACSVELLEKMKEFDRQWLQSIGWPLGCNLQIGVSSGYGFLGLVGTGFNMVLFSSDDAGATADKLATAAGSGRVLASKELLGGVGQSDRLPFRCGTWIHGPAGKMFRDNTFSRIVDLAEPPLPQSDNDSFASMPAAEVIPRTTNHQ